MAAEPSIAADTQSIYEQLENYPWDKDKEFQGGLSAILGPNPSPSQLRDLTLRAQCFYLSRKKSVPIEFDSYKAYLTSKKTLVSRAEAGEPLTTSESDHQETLSKSPFNPTTTQHAASSIPYESTPTLESAATMSTPNTPLDSSSFPSPQNAAGSNPGPQSDGAPYPTSFAEIVALIQSGAPIPGIRDIPSNPRGWAASSPAVLPKRRKPWETDVPEEIIQGRGPGIFGDERDNPIEQEYPDA